MAAVVHFLVFSCFIPCISLSEFPRGHGEELGKHRDSDGHIDTVVELPTPEYFWENYAKVRRPLLMKGAAKSFPSFRLWTDEYLMDNYGDLEVKLEHKKEKGITPVGYKGLGRDTIKSFLETYVSQEKYIVSQLPDPMATEVMILPFLTCGSFAERTLEANLWLSSGGTRSMLHRDADNAINCLLNGTKDWILIDPKYEDMIPIAEGDSGYGGFAVLDVDHVNLVKYPQVINLPWQYANISAGDCLFLPYGYWHQVRSYGSKNLATTVLFSRLTEFNNSGCDSGQLDFLRLSESSMVWTYPGHGPQTLGNLDPFELRDSLKGWVDATEDGKLTADILYQTLTEMQVLEEESQNALRWKLANDLLQSLDKEGLGYVTMETVENLSLEQLKTFAVLYDQDPANTEEFEHVVFTPDEIRLFLEEAVDKEKGVLTLEDFTNIYQDRGGSAKIATELFMELEPEEEGLVSKENLEKNMPKVLKYFEKTYYTEDKSGPFYERELQRDKAMMSDLLPQDPESTHTTKLQDEL